MKQRKWHWLYTLITFVLLAAAVAGTYNVYKTWETETAQQDDPAALLLTAPIPWLGDFDAMRERRIIRILVPYNKTWYFLDGARERGIVYDYGKEFERWLNKKYKIKYNQTIRVIFIPTSRDKLLPNLESGIGDIATGGLTITEKRQQRVIFSTPFITNVNELIITAPGAPTINSLDDLAGKEIYVRKSSSYWEHLEELNKKFVEEDKPEMILTPADENLEDEDILEMVNVDLVPIAVVDDYLVRYWKKIFSKIAVHEDLAINTNGTIAWSMRKDNPQLKAEIDEFMQSHAFGTNFQKEVTPSYLESTKYVTDATSQKEMKKFNAVVGFFKRYAADYDFDYLMLIAMGYQESTLDQSARSKRGAVGVMQVLPSTAEHPPVSIKGVAKSADKNIHAGVKYLHSLTEQYVNDPDIDPKNRLLLTFAAYNAGPGNLNKFRNLAKRSGLDPNVWFNNVEIAASRIVGQETVNYVGNIYQYYIAYSLITAHEKHIQKDPIKIDKAKR